MPDTRLLKTQTCPQCGKDFDLEYDPANARPETLLISSCLSGGIYEIAIKCPHCRYIEVIL